MLQDFHELWPEKFQNKTNGVTPRRWMVLGNPRLAQLITDAIGDGWITRPATSCARLEPLADDAGFRAEWRAIKQREQARTSRSSRCERTGVTVDPQSLFDVQVKRIHEYKRQHLNILHVIALYLRLKAAPERADRSRAPSSSAARRRRATTWRS